MALIYTKLIALGLIPVVFAILFHFLLKKTKFGKIPTKYQQLIIGVVFGGLSVLGTELGVDIEGSVANVRDASPLIAGLLFGGPSGIIAGVIGGVERFFAAYWGRGMFSQWACSISTILAGLYAALLKKFVFDDERPGLGFGIASGVVIEVLHFTILFFTRYNETEKVVQVLNILSLPMLIANSLSIGIACFAIKIIVNRKIIFRQVTYYQKITSKIQLRLLAVIVASFFVSVITIYNMQTNSAIRNTSKTLTSNSQDIGNDVFELTSIDLLTITKNISDDYVAHPSTPLDELKSQYNVEEISIINQNGNDGLIASSTNADLSGHLISEYQEINYFSVLFTDKQYDARHYEKLSFADRYMKYGAFKISGGFVLVGYNSLEFQNNIMLNIKSLSSNRHINNSGFVIIADRNNKVVNFDETINDKTLNEIGINLDDKQELDIFRLTYNDVDNRAMYSIAEDYRIITLLSDSEVFYNRSVVLYLLSFTEVIVFAVFFIVIYLFIKKLVVNNIRGINTSLNMITDGKLDTKVTASGCDEFYVLSRDINKTVAQLKHLIDEASSRIDKDLMFAKKIQASALPSSFPAYPNIKEFDIYAYMQTAKEVGGDFYDFFHIDGKHIAFLIADVSGKGIGAAMFMMETKSLIKHYVNPREELSTIIERVNDDICANNEAGMFVTCWIGVINCNTGAVDFVNAGHNTPLIYREKTKSWTYLKQSKNLVLGAMGGIKYKTQHIDLEPGDRIFLYTDGVSEANNVDGELYGEQRLNDILSNNYTKDIYEQIACVMDDVKDYINGTAQYDDITMLDIIYKGNDNEK